MAPFLRPYGAVEWILRSAFAAWYYMSSRREDVVVCLATMQMICIPGEMVTGHVNDLHRNSQELENSGVMPSSYIWWTSTVLAPFRGRRGGPGRC
jgi:hypothetical protein